MKPQPHRFLRLKEEQSASANEALAHKELLDKVSTGLIVLDERHSIRYANSAAYALLANKHIKRVLDSNLRYTQLTHPVEQMVLLPANESLHIQASAYEWNGEVAILFVLEKKITATTLAVEMLQKTIDALPEKILLIQDDVITYVNRSVISHWSLEVNEWIGAVTDDILLGYTANEEPFLVTVKQNFERATAVCRSVLLDGTTYHLLYLKPETTENNKKENGETDLVIAPTEERIEEDLLCAVDMENVLCKVLERLQPMIQSKSAVINSRKLPVVSGHKQTLSHVVETLLQNGIRFHKAEKAPLLDIGFDKYDGNIIFCVRDNGIGLSKNECESIFSREPKEEHGSVNLSWCKQALIKIGGDMWVESLPGSGSNFYFTVPAVTNLSHA